MALIKFGSGIAGASGKSGGTVYARNNAGAYMRNWAKPTNATTPLQSQARQRLSNAVAAWNGLTQGQVDAWNAYASTMIRLNRLGDSYTPKGRQIFIECYTNCVIGNVPVLTTPGPSSVSPSMKDLSFAALAGTAGLLTVCTVVTSSVDIPSDASYSDCPAIIYGAPAHSAGKGNVNKQRRVVVTETVDTLNSGLDIFAAFNAYFGATSADGLVIDLWVKAIDSGTGLASPIQKISKTIT